MLSKFDSRLVYDRLIVQFEVFNDCMLDVVSHDVCELGEPRPNDHIEFVEVEV